MAKFKMELPTELIEQMTKLKNQSTQMIEEMTEAGAEVVYDNVKMNMASSFKDSKKLEPFLKITKTYRTPSDNGINTKVGFYGYYKDKEFSITNKKGNTYTYAGVPVPLIVRAREFGSSSGEAKKPFFRKSFKKAQIEKAMMEVQKKYIDDGE